MSQAEVTLNLCLAPLLREEVVQSQHREALVPSSTSRAGSHPQHELGTR